MTGMDNATHPQGTMDAPPGRGSRRQFMSHRGPAVRRRHWRLLRIGCAALVTASVTAPTLPAAAAPLPRISDAAYLPENLVVRPYFFNIGVDTPSYLSGLDWSAWTSDEGRGTGIWERFKCFDPKNCPADDANAGSIVSTSVAVNVYRPVSSRYGTVFGRLSVAPYGGRRQDYDLTYGSGLQLGKENPAVASLPTVRANGTSGDLAVRPAVIQPGVTGRYELVKLKWSSWAAMGATATGYVEIYTCGKDVPICGFGEGHYVLSPARVDLSYPFLTAKGPEFSLFIVNGVMIGGSDMKPLGSQPL